MELIDQTLAVERRPSKVAVALLLISAGIGCILDIIVLVFTAIPWKDIKVIYLIGDMLGFIFLFFLTIDAVSQAPRFYKSFRWNVFLSKL
jgi:hypothetical protein